MNNDLFGIADSATAGRSGRHRARSASTAIQELQLVVSPVRRASGQLLRRRRQRHHQERQPTTFRVQLFYFFAQSRTGLATACDDRPIATFSDKQFGGHCRRPDGAEPGILLRQPYEWRRRETPSGWSVDGIIRADRSAVRRRFSAWLDIAAIALRLQSRRPTTEFIRQNPNDKVFVRGDFNLEFRHPVDGQAQLRRCAQRRRARSPTRDYFLPGPVLRVQQHRPTPRSVS